MNEINSSIGNESLNDSTENQEREINELDNLIKETEDKYNDFKEKMTFLLGKKANKYLEVFKKQHETLNQKVASLNKLNKSNLELEKSKEEIKERIENLKNRNNQLDSEFLRLKQIMNN